MFMSVYESEFCEESWEYLTSHCTYEEFIDMYNRVQYLSERKMAAEMDIEREENLKSAKTQRFK